jgi:hypothetical protein
MPSGGTTSSGERPIQVTIAVFLLIINAFVGLAAAAFGLWWSEDALSALGFLLAVFAFYVAKMLLDRNPQAWTWAVMVNIIGAVLYLFSIFAVEGIILCVLTLIYLNIPVVREHFN